MKKDEIKILLIIPAYNEEENILKTCKLIESYNKKHKTHYDILVINDGSYDKTKQILIDNHINHIDLIHNLGIGGAVQTGYMYAQEKNYDIAIQFDGDGQHDINYVKNIIAPIIEEQADMVIGSRFIEEHSSKFKSSLARRIGIILISYFIQFKTKVKIYDTTSGFRAINRKLIDLFAKSYPTEYPEPISTVEAIKYKFKIKEIPVNMNERAGGASSIYSWKKVYYMINVILSILLIGKKEK